MEFFRDTITVASTGLTFTTVIACFGVLHLWYHAAWKSWRVEHKVELNYFILGVVIGFFGSLVDNVYWGFAWFAELTQHPARDKLFDYGVYSNLFFRQLTTILAAVFHIRAALSSSSTKFKVIVYGGWCVGILSMVPMLLMADIGD